MPQTNRDILAQPGPESNLLADYPIQAPLGKFYLSVVPSLVELEAAEVAVVTSRMKIVTLNKVIASASSA